MRFGFVSTRLAGTDGVSLETRKLADVARRAGHTTYFCAGELDDDLDGLLAPELHFRDPVAQALGARAFGGEAPDPTLAADLAARSAELEIPLRRFLAEYRIDVVVAQNVFAIPMQLPLARALTDVLRDTGLPALAHNHDFYWERERFLSNRIPQYLDTYFPPELPRLRHAVINSAARRDLAARRGIDSFLLPNIFDFATPPPGIDAYNADFRRAIGIRDDDWLILQPTRVVPRKGIELAIELVARLDDPRAKLVITHEAGDEGFDYLHRLQAQAAAQDVDLRYVADIVDDARGVSADGRKIYSLWDTYPHADLITYPSLYEGFGNALLETIYFRKPALVNRYSVYIDDIAPLGFQFAEIDAAVNDDAVDTVRRWLRDPASAKHAVDRNFRLATAHFSYKTCFNTLQREKVI